jgi:hypothetical protein
MDITTLKRKDLIVPAADSWSFRAYIAFLDTVTAFKNVAVGLYNASIGWMTGPLQYYDYGISLHRV